MFMDSMYSLVAGGWAISFSLLPFPESGFLWKKTERLVKNGGNRRTLTQYITNDGTTKVDRISSRGRPSTW